VQRRNKIYHDDVEALEVNINNRQRNLWRSVNSTAARRWSRISGMMDFSEHRHQGQTSSRFSSWFRPVPNLTDPASHRHFSLHNGCDPGMR